MRRSRSYYSTDVDAEIPEVHLTVFEEEQGPINTGLLGKDGQAIFRSSDRQQLGFLPVNKPKFRVRAISRVVRKA